jgi:hypothetical protein
MMVVFLICFALLIYKEDKRKKLIEIREEKQNKKKSTLKGEAKEKVS